MIFRLAIALALLLYPVRIQQPQGGITGGGGAVANWAFVRVTTAATGASTNPNVVALPSGTTAHNVLVAVYALNGTSGEAITGVSGRCNSTWTSLTSRLNSGDDIEIWYCLDAIGGAGNVSGTAGGGTLNFLDGYVQEYSFNGGSTVAVDGTPPVGTNGTSTSAATGTVTTTGTNDVILAAAITPSTSSVNNSFTLRSTADGNGVASRITQTAAGYTVTFTTTSGHWCAVIGALKSTP